jgi:hypothetical protein
MAIKRKRVKHHSIDGLLSFIADVETRARLEAIRQGTGLSLSALCRLSVSLIWVIYDAEGKLPTPKGMNLNDFKKCPGRRVVYQKKREELIKDASKQ